MQYDIAQVCENGHVITSWYSDSPNERSPFCDKCGATTIINCPECNTPIRGNVVNDFPILNFQAPSFCRSCGKPYPWTQVRLAQAKEFAEELDVLNQEEKQVLVTSLNDLVKDTPATPLATLRFKRLMVKVGSTTAGVFREILVDVLSEAARKAVFPN